MRNTILISGFLILVLFTSIIAKLEFQMMELINENESIKNEIKSISETNSSLIEDSEFLSKKLNDITNTMYYDSVFYSKYKCKCFKP